ncbi:glycosyltransferase family 4 protein [Alcaligenaceae bacterium]|nr:glycosyltransferase family 4 protein [Alcaligenaceae bacterium]
MDDLELEILQCAREIKPAGGVSGVAYELERQLTQAGKLSDRFTIESLNIRKGAWASSRSLILRKIQLFRDVVGYSVIGTYILKRKYQRRRQLVSICHNDVLFGDIYVNHGLHKEMWLQSKSPIRMLLRNPLHLFLLVREWLRFRLNVHRRVVCFSKSEGDLLVKHYPNAKSMLEIIPNGVDIERFTVDPTQRTDIRKRLGIEDDNFLLIFVGHEFERKGLAYIIHALTGLPDTVQLLVIGGGAEQNIQRYVTLSEEAGVAERVHFLGTRRDVPALMNASDMFVMPSYFEAWPLVGLEAMACGVPALMTAVGGVPDFLQDGVNGFIIQRSSDDLQEKIQLVLGDAALHARMRHGARETAVRYAWNVIAARYLALARQVRAEKTDA